MSRQLWLFRHGIAEKKSPSKNDVDRALTTKGKKEVARSAPHLRYLLDLRYPVFIWSSPLARALQTAELLSGALADTEIEEKEWIAAGDLTLLAPELDSLPEACTVIVVGHEPSLSEWAESLTGISLPFGKGACAALDLKSISKADLRWFHQSESLQTMGTADNADSFKLKLLLQKHIKQAQSLHAAFLEDPVEPETTHQLRVELRHLRSMLSFLKPLLVDTVYEEATVPLKEAFHQFSYLRELDVLIEEIEKTKENAPELISNPEIILTNISEAREKEKSRLIHSSNQSKIRNILKGLWSWTESVDWFPIVLEEDTFAQFVDKKINQQHKKLKKQLKKLDTSNADEVHQARIESKKYRYVLDDFSSLLENKHKKAYKWAKKNQDRLSIVPDLQHNMLALDGFIKDNENTTLKDDFAVIYDYEKERLEEQLTKLQDKPPKLE